MPLVSPLMPVPHMYLNSIIIIFTLGIKDPEGFGKKLEETCLSDHYSGQSSNTKESCSSTPLNRCTSTEMRWNKKLSLARHWNDD